MNEPFSQAERQALYRVMELRRDIRHFSSEPIPTEILERILEAAHIAPSVGFMQPWNFILISSLQIRQSIKTLFEETNRAELAKITEQERKELYRSLKLEGILEAPLNIAVTCDRERDAPFVLGRGAMPEMDLFSTCLAIENLWLAARAEGIGIGWVSLFDRPSLEKLLELPPNVRLVAYLCAGYPLEFRAKPLLEEVGWKNRLNLANLVYHDKWGEISPLFGNEKNHPSL
ncbi:MAG: 5,6-dimethylbenzimidazole synthase [Chloroflexi bacterium]|nr:5,6-dimethylbenzimidazole synthase [Chloroflexota bacterium]